MAKMSKAQARKRVMEARKKLMGVYSADNSAVYNSIKGQDMMAIDKILDKILSKLG